MIVNKLPIYLVSLESDAKRREQLAKLFPVYYKKMTHIKATDGRKLTAKEYYNKIMPYFMATGNLMSPSELGCSLSHMETMRQFLESGQPYALILEDDVLGNDAAIDKIQLIAQNLAKNSILICGGQEGLSSRKYLFGIPRLNPRVYRLAKFSHKYVWRTCCYVVTQTSAQVMLRKNFQKILLADDWSNYFSGQKFDIYFSELLKHPNDLAISHIEKDRALFRNANVLNKNFNFYFLKRIAHKLKIEATIFLCRISGYKKICNQP